MFEVTNCEDYNPVCWGFQL